MKSQNKKAWGGRFAQKSHRLLEVFNASLPFDRRLYAEDIAGSKAHAHLLFKEKILTKVELAKIIKGLDLIKNEIETGKFNWSLADEDIHMAIEARLIRMIGNVGAKLHTARSRNDQVATDLRLFCKRQVSVLIHHLSRMQYELVMLAEQRGFVPMPGYTHLQRAQPVYLAHHLMAYYEMFDRDVGRLADAYTRVDTCPLGSGALAGSTLLLDRQFVAKQLGFHNVSANSMDAVSDRDFVAEILFCTSVIMMHLSRLADELVLWSTQEFNFIKLPEDYCTGSSMMPQKINPDVPELVRGKTGRVYGDLMQILTVLKGLPLTYNKDLQEDKESLFDGVDTTLACLEVMIGLLPGVEVHESAMALALQKGFLLATDLAEYLVQKQVPFREAHEVVGNIVCYCEQKKLHLEDLDLKTLQSFAKVVAPDVYEVLHVQAALDRRKTYGGTAKNQVKMQIRRAKKRFS